MPSETNEIRYAGEAVGDLRGMRSFDRQQVLDTIEVHLRHQPTFVSKSRIKAMVQPFWSQYRLRIGDFRVYYDVNADDRGVNVLRVLMKNDDSNAGGIAVKTVTWMENASWDEVLRQAAEEDVIVLRDGHPLVLMTPFDEDDLAWYARERDPAFLESLAKARRQVEQGKTVSHENLKKELGLD